MLRSIVLGAVSAMIVGAATLGSCAYAANIRNSLNVPNWSGGAYLNERTKVFDRCAATKGSGEGTSISYSVDQEYHWNVSLSNPAWNFVKGAIQVVNLKIGDENVSNATAIAVDKTVLELQTSDPITFFARFRVARQLRIGIGGLLLEFSLDGGEEVLSALTQCVLRATNFSKIEKARSAILDSHDASDVAKQKEASAIVADIISYSHLPDSKVLPAAEQFFNLTADATWKIGLITNHLIIFDVPIPIASVSEALIARSSRACQRGFFFISQPDKINQLQIERTFTSCQATETTISSHFLVIPRSKSGYYILAVVSTGSSFLPIAHRAAADYEARLRSIVMTAIQSH
jgi:hypothetical protein